MSLTIIKIYNNRLYMYESFVNVCFCIYIIMMKNSWKEAQPIQS